MKYVKTVIYYPVICPYCQSEKTYIRTKKSKGKEVVRYHYCRECKRSFRSVED